MEHILALYALPYDPQYPVICFDERPCFLIGETLLPVPMRPGKLRKEHYAYEKCGSCALLAAIEPLTGRRLGQVHPQRTTREYTLFCQALAAMYPAASKLRLVQDNSTRTTPAPSMNTCQRLRPLPWQSASSSSIRPSRPVG
jgi:hypothetical protein